LIAAALIADNLITGRGTHGRPVSDPPAVTAEGLAKVTTFAAGRSAYGVK
jgi:hypothetical protein